MYLQTSEEKNSCMVPISELEIKETLRVIEGKKSNGHDGLRAYQY